MWLWANNFNLEGALCDVYCFVKRNTNLTVFCRRSSGYPPPKKF